MTYVVVPSLMVFLSLVLPVRVTRLANIVLAVVYAATDAVTDSPDQSLAGTAAHSAPRARR